MARTKTFDECKVLDEAILLFWSNGYNATSMQDLVDALGINRSSMYDTYGDKRELFIAALRQYSTNATGAMVQMLDEADDAKEVIRKIFDSVIGESLCDEDKKGCFMINTCIEVAPHDAEIATIVQEDMQAVEHAFARLLKRGQDAGKINPQHSPLALTRFITNSLHGIRVMAKTGGDKNAFRDIEKITLSML